MTDEPENPPPDDSTVKLTQDVHIAVIDHINRKAISPNDSCIVCGDANNNVVESVYRVDVSTSPLVIGAPYQPLYSTVCNNCGFVRFFNKYIVDWHINEHGKNVKSDPEIGDRNGG